MTSSLLLFLHIPKTAGSTLHSVLSSQFPPDEILTIDSSDPESSVKEIKALPIEDKMRIKCVRGHMPFGLHAYFPQPATYITFLRDPVDRIISHYYYLQSSPQHYLYEVVTSKHMSLADYATSGISSELLNGQTRLISGYEEPTPTTETLALAKENLSKQFSFIGLTERFNDSLVLLARQFGWRNVFYVKRNVTRGRLRREEIPGKVLSQIMAQNALDWELYTFAKHMFAESVLSYGKTFKLDVRVFRVRNRAYQAIQTVMRCTK